MGPVGVACNRALNRGARVESAPAGPYELSVYPNYELKMRKSFFTGS